MGSCGLFIFKLILLIFKNSVLFSKPANLFSKTAIYFQNQKLKPKTYHCHNQTKSVPKKGRSFYSPNPYRTRIHTYNAGCD